MRFATPAHIRADGALRALVSNTYLLLVLFSFLAALAFAFADAHLARHELLVFAAARLCAGHDNGVAWRNWRGTRRTPMATCCNPCATPSRSTSSALAASHADTRTAGRALGGRRLFSLQTRRATWRERLFSTFFCYLTPASMGGGIVIGWPASTHCSYAGTHLDPPPTSAPPPVTPATPYPVYCLLAGLACLPALPAARHCLPHLSLPSTCRAHAAA